MKHCHRKYLGREAVLGGYLCSLKQLHRLTQSWQSKKLQKTHSCEGFCIALSPLSICLLEAFIRGLHICLKLNAWTTFGTMESQLLPKHHNVNKCCQDMKRTPILTDSNGWLLHVAHRPHYEANTKSQTKLAYIMFVKSICLLYRKKSEQQALNPLDSLDLIWL